jgi:hypothetical protein
MPSSPPLILFYFISVNSGVGVVARFRFRKRDEQIEVLPPREQGRLAFLYVGTRVAE